MSLTDEERSQLDEAFAHVVNRQDDHDESLEEAVEAVYPDFGGMEFRAKLIAFARFEIS